MPLMNMMNDDFPKHFPNNGEFPRFDDGFDETRGYLLCVEWSPCRPWVNHHVYWLNGNSCWWTIFHANFCFLNDPFHGYLIPLAGFKVSIKTPALFQHNFSRFWDTWRAPLITFVYLHAPFGLSKRWWKTTIIFNIVENHQEMESCHVMLKKLHQNLIEISNDRANLALIR